MNGEWTILLWILVGVVFLMKITAVRDLVAQLRMMSALGIICMVLSLGYFANVSYTKDGLSTNQTSSQTASPLAKKSSSIVQDLTLASASVMPTWWNDDDTDTDDDGIPDLWEKWTHGNRLVDDDDLDRDSDGLTDLEEFQNQTDPRTADTDGDGFSDAFEVANGLNPTTPEDFTPIEPDVDHNGRIDLWENAPYIYGFTDADHDGFDDTYELYALETASDGNFDVIVDVYTTRSAVLTWNDGLDGIVLLPTTGQAVRLRLPFGVDSTVNLLPSPTGADPPTGELWKSRMRLAFSPRSGQRLYGNALVSPDCMIAHKVVTQESAIEFFAPLSPMSGFQTLSLTGGGTVGPSTDFKAGIFEVNFGDKYHDLGDGVGAFTVTNHLGMGEAIYDWSSAFGDMYPDSGMESWLTVTRLPEYDDKMTVVTATELDSESRVAVTSIVEKCSPRVFSASLSTCNFSPQLGETNVISVTLPECEHIPIPGWLEIEVVRETIGATQHVASVDMDVSTSTIDRYLDTSSLGGQSPSFPWDGRAQVGLPLADHPDIFTAAKGSFHRAMPVVEAGEPVPPPFLTVRVRRWNSEKTVLLNEYSETVFIPQLVLIQWDSAAIELFKAPLFYEFEEGGSNLLYTGFTGTADELFQRFCVNLQGYFPSDVNIRFAAVPPAYDCAVKKLFVVPDVKFTLDEENKREYKVGQASSFNSRNARSDNEMECYAGSLIKVLGATYQKYASGFGKEKALLYPMSYIPLSAETNLLAWARVAAHETGHGLGLVDPFYMNTDRNFGNSHNPDDDDTKIMFRSMSTIISFHEHRGTWNDLNHSYLRFILPRPSEP